MGIHNYKRQFERNLERIQESKELLPENRKVILDFKDYLLSEGIGIARINRLLFELMKYSRMFKKPFSGASKEDIRVVVARIEQTDLSAETKKCSKIMLKKLYKFIRKIDEECKIGEICVNEECEDVEDECVNNIDCKESEVYIEGECEEIEEPECTVDTDCKEDETCVEGECEKSEA